MGKRFDVKEVLAAVDRYQARSGRITTIQYCLLEGVNDSLAQARDLARLLEGRRMHVNLLRYNATGLSLRGRNYAPSPMAQTEAEVGAQASRRSVRSRLSSTLSSRGSRRRSAPRRGAEQQA
jgi:23S rRNA (adenine2503-C2)-methyltransferase